MFEQKEKKSSGSAETVTTMGSLVWEREIVCIGFDIGVGKQLPSMTHFLDIRSRAPIVERGGLRLEQDVQVPSSQGTQSPSPIRAPRGDFSLLHVRR